MPVPKVLFARSVFKAGKRPKQPSSLCLWFWLCIPDGDSSHHVLEQMWQNDGSRQEVLLRKQQCFMLSLASCSAGLRKSQLSKLSEPSGPTRDQILMSLSNQPFPLLLSQHFLSLPLYCTVGTCSLKKLSAKPASNFRAFLAVSSRSEQICSFKHLCQKLGCFDQLNSLAVKE